MVGSEEFLRRFRAKFGDTIVPYMDEYVNTQSRMHFKCQKCGHVFIRMPDNCLASDGCPKCNNVHNQMMTTDEFISRAREVHGDKYDYSKVEYKGTDVKVCVICHEKDRFGDEHGEFHVTPHSHIGMMRSGCPKCSGKFRKDTEYFVRELNAVHGDKYDYSKVRYVSALKAVEVVCPTHGSFYATPNQLLSGRGCPYCNASHLEREVENLLKDNGIEYEAQARLDWLVTDDTHKKMSLDFLLNDINIAIECQGIQHFSSEKFWSGSSDKEAKVDRIKHRDMLKRRLCEEHGIKVLYYSNLWIEYPYKVIEGKENLLSEITKIMDEKANDGGVQG